MSDVMNRAMSQAIGSQDVHWLSNELVSKPGTEQSNHDHNEQHVKQTGATSSRNEQSKEHSSDPMTQQ